MLYIVRGSDTPDNFDLLLLYDVIELAFFQCYSMPFCSGRQSAVSSTSSDCLLSPSSLPQLNRHSPPLPPSSPSLPLTPLLKFYEAWYRQFFIARLSCHLTGVRSAALVTPQYSPHTSPFLATVDHNQHRLHTPRNKGRGAFCESLLGGSKRMFGSCRGSCAG